MDILFTTKYSKIYDVCQAIVAKTNPEGKWINEYIVDKNVEKDSKYIKKLLSKVSSIDDRMYLFSNLEIKSNSFLSECYLSFVHEDSDSCTIEGFCKYLRNFGKIMGMMCKYYFGIEAENEKVMLKLCYESEIDNSLKALMYEFLMFQDTYMETVEREIGQVAFSIQKLYEARNHELEQAQLGFEFEAFQKKIKELKNGDQWEESLERINISFSIWNRYLIMRNTRGKEGYLIIGIDYKGSLYKVSNEKLDLAVFGNAIGDSVRQKILKTVLENGELSVGEIIRNIGGTPTAILYHLDILKKANLIKSRSSGRKVLCWVNDKQIGLAIKALESMRKGGEQR